MSCCYFFQVIFLYVMLCSSGVIQVGVLWFSPTRDMIGQEEEAPSILSARWGLILPRYPVVPAWSSCLFRVCIFSASLQIFYSTKSLNTTYISRLELVVGFVGFFFFFLVVYLNDSIFHFKKIFCFIFDCVWLCTCKYRCSWQPEVSDPLELGSQTVVSCLT